MSVNGVKFFMLMVDYEYDFKGNKEIISRGTIFYGGLSCQYPALRQYATCWGNKRYWFDPEFVENSEKLFNEVFVM